MEGLSGLASGVDTALIVERLMSLERGGRSRVALRERRVLATDTALRDIQAKLRALTTAAAALRDPGLWSDTQTVASSDRAVASAVRVGGAGTGAYSIAVTRLAAAEQRTYDYAPPPADSAITIGAVTVPVAAGATLGDVVAAVNGADAGVYATDLGGRLVLSSKAAGAAGGFVAAGEAITEDPTRLRAGADAEFSIDGGPARTSPSNTVADAVAGLRLTLSALGSADIVVGEPATDATAVKDKVRAFVEAYNAVVTTVRAKTGERGVRDPRTVAEAEKGVLFGDSGLVGLLARMRVAVADGTSLGIGTGAATGAAPGADARAGRLTFDEARFDAALAAGPPAVRTALAGLAGSVDAVLEGQATSGGVFEGRLRSSESELGRLRAEMARWDVRLAEKEKRLKAQFAAMETALGLAQSQQAWLAGQLGSLDRS